MQLRPTTRPRAEARLALVDPTAMVDALHDDDPLRHRKRCQKAEVADSELTFVRTYQPLKVALGLPRRTLKTLYDSFGDGPINRLQIANRRVGPSNLPWRQSPNRFFTSS